MTGQLSRRRLLQSVAASPSFFAGGGPDYPARRLKTSINAYSFHRLLSSGAMELSDLLAFCAEHGLDGADLTAYYFPGYPEVASDDYLFRLKREAFRLGIGISGMGVRNDFSQPDAARRAGDVALVKSWIVAAAKMGAPVLRIFSGRPLDSPSGREAVLERMVKDIRSCVDFGKEHGVILAVQNHYDFLKTAAETIELIRRVDSPWFGLVLDIGSFRGEDPYGEIAKCLPHAVNWQIKELVYENGVAKDADLERLRALISASGYRGYLPVETLRPGDPYRMVPAFLNKVREAFRLC